jgi:hypothetical protein
MQRANERTHQKKKAETPPFPFLCGAVLRMNSSGGTLDGLAARGGRDPQNPGGCPSPTHTSRSHKTR